MLPVTAIFDIGRTNKKFFLFDKNFREVHREYVTFAMIEDEDGFPCEDIHALTDWLQEVFHRILDAEEYRVEAINFSSYGASFVHIGHDGRVLTPLYNYEKPLPGRLEQKFYDTHAASSGERELNRATGSDRAGMLNSGKQLYWLKHERPEVFRRIKYSLHLPQFLSYVFTGIPVSEYTSIGCHTGLWDYRKGDYHDWVYAEEIDRVLPPVVGAGTSINLNYNGRRVRIGVGIHDSSAALLPYLRSGKKPFALVSTGTWSVSLNPFTDGPLTAAEYDARCINYMRTDGRPVKAARLFLGEEYKAQTQVLREVFGAGEDRHKSVTFDPKLYRAVLADDEPWFRWTVLDEAGSDRTVIPPGVSYEHAYHRLMVELTRLQVASLRTAIGDLQIRKLFIDGGFSDNDVFLNLLSHHFRDVKVRTTDSSLGSALGAAICISDRELGAGFLKKNYGLRKHRPFILPPN